MSDSSVRVNVCMSRACMCVFVCVVVSRAYGCVWVCVMCVCVWCRRRTACRLRAKYVSTAPRKLVQVVLVVTMVVVLRFFAPVLMHDCSPKDKAMTLCRGESSLSSDQVTLRVAAAVLLLCWRCNRAGWLLYRGVVPCRSTGRPYRPSGAVLLPRRRVQSYGVDDAGSRRGAPPRHRLR
jgi:hypothetical protein